VLSKRRDVDKFEIKGKRNSERCHYIPVTWLFHSVYVFRAPPCDSLWEMTSASEFVGLFESWATAFVAKLRSSVDRIGSTFANREEVSIARLIASSLHRQRVPTDDVEIVDLISSLRSRGVDETDRFVEREFQRVFDSFCDLIGKHGDVYLSEKAENECDPDFRKRFFARITLENMGSIQPCRKTPSLRMHASYTALSRVKAELEKLSDRRGDSTGSSRSEPHPVQRAVEMDAPLEIEEVEEIRCRVPWRAMADICGDMEATMRSNVASRLDYENRRTKSLDLMRRSKRLFDAVAARHDDFIQKFANNFSHAPTSTAATLKTTCKEIMESWKLQVSRSNPAELKAFFAVERGRCETVIQDSIFQSQMQRLADVLKTLHRAAYAAQNEHTAVGLFREYYDGCDREIDQLIRLLEPELGAEPNEAFVASSNLVTELVRIRDSYEAHKTTVNGLPCDTEKVASAHALFRDAVDKIAQRGVQEDSARYIEYVIGELEECMSAGPSRSFFASLLSKKDDRLLLKLESLSSQIDALSLARCVPALDAFLSRLSANVQRETKTELVQFSRVIKSYQHKFQALSASHRSNWSSFSAPVPSKFSPISPSISKNDLEYASTRYVYLHATVMRLSCFPPSCRRMALRDFMDAVFLHHVQTLHQCGAKDEVVLLR
jgi:hypothetical protein